MFLKIPSYPHLYLMNESDCEFLELCFYQEASKSFYISSYENSLSVQDFSGLYTFEMGRIGLTICQVWLFYLRFLIL